MYNVSQIYIIVNIMYLVIFVWNKSFEDVLYGPQSLWWQFCYFIAFDDLDDGLMITKRGVIAANQLCIVHIAIGQLVFDCWPWFQLFPCNWCSLLSLSFVHLFQSAGFLTESNYFHMSMYIFVHCLLTVMQFPYSLTLAGYFCHLRFNNN